jgi:hypothetical protein
MLITLCIALTLTAVVTTAVLNARYRRARQAAPNLVTQVFGRREFRQLDMYLEAVAAEERRHVEAELARYVAGRTGHVVVVRKTPLGIALELSDGRHLALRGISPRAVELIDRRARTDILRPESLDRDAFSYRLQLRGAGGAHIKVYARNVALAT